MIEKAQKHSQTEEHTIFLKLLSQTAVFYQTLKVAQAVHVHTYRSGSCVSTIARRSSPGKKNVIHSVRKCHSKHAIIKTLPLQQQSCWLKNFHSRSVMHSLCRLKAAVPSSYDNTVLTCGAQNPYCYLPLKGKLTCKSIRRDTEAVMWAELPPCIPPSLSVLQGQGDRA